jgi:hypothetical protein
MVTLPGHRVTPDESLTYQQLYPINALRNLAIEAAGTPLVLFTEGDFLPSRGLCEELGTPGTQVGRRLGGGGGRGAGWGLGGVSGTPAPAGAPCQRPRSHPPCSCRRPRSRCCRPRRRGRASCWCFPPLSWPWSSRCRTPRHTPCQPTGRVSLRHPACALLWPSMVSIYACMCPGLSAVSAHALPSHSLPCNLHPPPPLQPWQPTPVPAPSPAACSARRQVSSPWTTPPGGARSSRCRRPTARSGSRWGWWPRALPPASTSASEGGCWPRCRPCSGVQGSRTSPLEDVCAVCSSSSGLVLDPPHAPHNHIPPS